MKSEKRKAKNKNLKFKMFLVLICCFALCALSFEIASAYTLLQELPGQGGEVSGLSDYLTWLYRFALGAAIFLAVLKIVIGGIYIIVGGASETARTKGREMIEMALWGLLLAVSAWLLLNTINPDFVTGKFGISPVTIESKLPPASTGVDTTATVTQSGTEDTFHKTESDSSTGQPSVGTPSSDIQNLKNYVSQMNAQNSSVLIDKSDKKMYIYYFGNDSNGELIATIPIDIGKNDLNGTKNGGYNGDGITPVGDFTITSDRRTDFTNGVYNSQGVNMGPVFMGLSAKDQNGNYRGIGIHGSKSGGLSSTIGCIRVNNADLSTLYAGLKSDTKIKIRN